MGKDVLYTEAEENRIKMKISDESTMLSAEYDYNGMADFLKLLENIDEVMSAKGRFLNISR